MLRVDHERWNQTLADLRRLALTATHDRSREHFLALHEGARGACTTEVAARTGRYPQTVMGWPHGYNEHGPEAPMYRRTGGRPFCTRIRTALGQEVYRPPLRANDNETSFSREFSLEGAEG